MAPFTGFDDADFDAYVESKWSSNVYNLERMRVKDKLVALGRSVSSSMLATDGSLLSFEPSADHPTLSNNKQVKGQYLYFLRSESARQELHGRVSKGKKITQLLQDTSPYAEHLHLSVGIETEGLTIAVQLNRDAQVDHNNLTRKLDTHWERTKFPPLIAALGDRFRVEVGNAPVEPADGEKTVEALTALAPDATPVFRISSRIDRTDPRLSSEAAVDTVREDLLSLLPIYQFMEWSRANDHISVAEDIKKEKKEKKRKGLAPKDRVRVTSGLWSGKKGLVQEVDGRGNAKVLIGKVVVQLGVDDLVRL